MSAMVAYHGALLLRSQRWLVPVLFYAAVLAAGSNGHEPLGDALAWSAAMAIPAVAWLTRTCLTNEPTGARACLASAGGARRAQLGALVVALGGAIVMVLAGTGFELAVSAAPSGSPGRGAVTGAGLVAGLACAVIGTAIGALCNPPLIRRPGAAALATVTLVVLALASRFSPALAAIHRAAPVHGSHVPALPALAAVVVAGAAWYGSVLAAAQRS